MSKTSAMQTLSDRHGGRGSGASGGDGGLNWTPPVRPVVTTADESIAIGGTFAASSLIASVTDANDDAITQYAFRVEGDNGSLSLDGVAQADNHWVLVSADDLAELQFDAGASTGSVKIEIDAVAGDISSRPVVATVTQMALSTYADGALADDILAQVSNGQLSYSGMLTILQDAAQGGMTASKFETLQTLASELNGSGSGAIQTSAYLQYIADAVIDEVPGGLPKGGHGRRASRTDGLGATSTATQVDDIIGQWFLGADLPNTNVGVFGKKNLASTYQVSTNPLFAQGGPSYLDVNQGNTGDAAFLAAIADVALQDPSEIQSMFVAEGDGIYGVRFVVDGKDDWVTVNSELPTLTGASPWANGSDLEFANGSALWPELLEKAWAEFNRGDSYAAISGGTGATLCDITGQTVNSITFGRHFSSSDLPTDNTTLSDAFSSGDELLVGTSRRAQGADLTGSHMFEVIAYNASDDTLTLHNPRGSAASSSTPVTFTETLAALASDDCVVYYTSGKPVA